jgi:recombinational DNA repair protein (RecF pathway)
VTGRVRTPALILRTRAYQDDDLIVDFLGQSTGRVSAVARAARKSPRRYGGPLEMGCRVDLELTFRAGRELQSLSRCEVVVPIRQIRLDYDRIAALAYMLELVRLCAREGQGDPRLYGLAGEIVDVLEAHAPTTESIVLWEIALLANLGYATSAVALAREAGLGPEAGRTLERLWSGDVQARLDAPSSARLRLGFERLWQRAVGHTPRSARFLELDSISV